MATAKQFIDECYKHLGETELYTGENPDWAWCAKFLSSVAKDLGMTQFDSWAASDIYAACEPVSDEEVQPGDFVCFNFDGQERTNWFDHIGCVTWFDHGTDYYGTIEGNSGSNFCVGEYVYYNETYPPKTYFCRPQYDVDEKPWESLSQEAAEVLTYKGQGDKDLWQLINEIHQEICDNN